MRGVSLEHRMNLILPFLPTISLNKHKFAISSTLGQALRRLRRLDTARVHSNPILIHLSAYLETFRGFAITIAA